MNRRAIWCSIKTWFRQRFDSDYEEPVLTQRSVQPKYDVRVDGPNPEYDLRLQKAAQTPLPSLAVNPGKLALAVNQREVRRLRNSEGGDMKVYATRVTPSKSAHLHESPTDSPPAA